MPGQPYDAPYLARNAANFAALSPLGFLARSAAVYPDKLAVIDGERRFTYREFYVRCRRFADALRRRGIGPGDTVAVMAPNVPASGLRTATPRSSPRPLPRISARLAAARPDTTGGLRHR